MRLGAFMRLKSRAVMPRFSFVWFRSVKSMVPSSVSGLLPLANAWILSRSRKLSFITISSFGRRRSMLYGSEQMCMLSVAREPDMRGAETGPCTSSIPLM